MTSKKTTTADGTTARPTCSFPGCDQLAAPAEKPGRPPEYCAGRGHTRASAWKERRRLNAEKNGTTISAAEERAQAAEADRDAAVAKARADADKRIADAQAERDAAIAKAQTDAADRVRAAEAPEQPKLTGRKG
jgi:hypothetical protein